MKLRIFISAALLAVIAAVCFLFAHFTSQAVYAMASAFLQENAVQCTAGTVLLSALIKKTMLYALLLSAAIILAFAAIALLFIPSVLKLLRIERAGDFFMAETESRQAFGFVFSLVSKELVFTGSNDFIFGKNTQSLPYDQFNQLETYLHKSDFAFFNEIRLFIYQRLSEVSFSKEIRIRRTDGSYAWFRITARRSDEGRSIVGNVTNVNEQVIRELELREKAETDLLSGLLNKVSLEQHIKELIARQGDSLVGALYIIDLDNFKQVNDRIGHSMGDMAICDVAAKLKLVFSERDYIARIGGDEYCVFLRLRENMLPNQMTAIITEKGRTLCAILEEDYNGEQAVVHVTASVGIALFPQQAQSYKELFRWADTALYHVKRCGKNDFAIYESHMKSGTESIYL